MKKPILLFAVLGFGVAFLTVPSVASASGARDFGTFRYDSAFKDLPGVKPERQARPRNDVTCTSSIVEDKSPFPSSRSWARPELVYRCTQGDATFESDRAPYPMERQRRGLNW